MKRFIRWVVLFTCHCHCSKKVVISSQWYLAPQPWLTTHLTLQSSPQPYNKISSDKVVSDKHASVQWYRKVASFTILQVALTLSAASTRSIGMNPALFNLPQGWKLQPFNFEACHKDNSATLDFKRAAEDCHKGKHEKLVAENGMTKAFSKLSCYLKREERFVLKILCAFLNNKFL